MCRGNLNSYVQHDDQYRCCRLCYSDRNDVAAAFVRPYDRMVRAIAADTGDTHSFYCDAVSTSENHHKIYFHSSALISLMDDYCCLVICRCHYYTCHYRRVRHNEILDYYVTLSIILWEIPINQYCDDRCNVVCVSQMGNAKKQKREEK